MDSWEYQYAYFCDADKQYIKIIWLDNGKEIEEVIPANDDFHRYMVLLNYVTLDQIHVNTAEYHKAERSKFRELVIDIAKQDGLIYSENNPIAEGLVNVLTLPDEQVDQKQLFDFKLVLFESAPVVNSKKSKTKLRKAKTYKQAISEFIKFI